MVDCSNCCCWLHNQIENFASANLNRFESWKFQGRNSGTEMRVLIAQKLFHLVPWISDDSIVAQLDDLIVVEKRNL